MKKIFLLGAKPWAFLFIGSIFLINATLSYFKQEQSTIDYWMMVINFLAGGYALFYAILTQTDLLGTAPKVVVYNEGVLLKSKTFSAGREIKWGEIKSITFHSYQIDFKLETAPLFFPYRSSATASKKIKEAIRDMADMKSIPITGG